MTKSNFMIDLETLGTFMNAPVVTVGAAFFDPMTGEIGAKFYEKIDIADAMKYGTADAETIRWWLTQAPEAQKELASAKSAMADVLNALTAFYNTGRDAKVWANGPSFDVTILDYAYWKCLGKKAPWPFWNVRDVRTVVQLAEGLVKKPAAFTKGTAHNALDDCIFQIGYVSKMFAALRGGTGNEDVL
jgi:hypothetical protein